MAEPIRVLHILQRMEAGGTQALLMNIYRKLDRSKVQFDFLVEYKEKQFYDEEIISLGGRIYYTSVREDFNILKFQRELYWILKNHPEYKIVHVHTYSIGYFCLKTAQKAGIPVRIAHSHSNGMTKDSKKYVKKIMQRLFLVHATDFFACSEEAGKYLFNDKEFRVLPNAIDAPKFVASDDTRAKVRKELGLENKFVVGHTGRFRPEKNHTFLLEVFDAIKKRKNDACLLLVGDGEMKNEIRKLVAGKGLENDVIFLGNRKDMSRIYQAMDVFVFPSFYEGLGIVAIEAQAAGVPVVCSDRVPLDTKVTELYSRHSLDENPQIWADECLKISELKMCHTDTMKFILEAGFDVSATARMMQKYYLEKYKTAQNGFFGK